MQRRDRGYTGPRMLTMGLSGRRGGGESTEKMKVVKSWCWFHRGGYFIKNNNFLRTCITMVLHENVALCVASSSSSSGCSFYGSPLTTVDHLPPSHPVTSIYLHYLCSLHLHWMFASHSHACMLSCFWLIPPLSYLDLVRLSSCSQISSIKETVNVGFLARGWNNPCVSV